MTLPRIPDDENPVSKEAKRMRDLLQPNFAAREIAKTSTLPPASVAAEEIKKHLQGSFMGTASSLAAMEAQALSQAERSMLDQLSLPARLSHDAATEAAKMSLQPVKNDKVRLLEQYHNEAFNLQQKEYGKQLAREEEKLELQRRAVAASETALEEERERTREAKAEAVVQTKARRVAERNTRIAIVIAFAGLLIAAWPFIKDQFL